MQQRHNVQMVEEEKGRGWEKKKKSLVTYEDLPEFLKDNPSILGHYRMNYSYLRSLQSIFEVHNESINIWSHTFGVLLFAYLIFAPDSYLHTVRHLEAQQMPQVPIPSYCLEGSVSSSNNLIVKFWCYLGNLSEEASHTVFLVSAKLCLFGSAVFHTFSSHAEYHVIRFFNQLDYAGISILITGSTYPFMYYAFHCDFVWRANYLFIMTVLGIVIAMASFFRFWSTPVFRSYRAAIYVVFGALGALPFLQAKLVTILVHGTFTDTPAEQRFPLRYPLLMGFFYILGAIIYAYRFPETLLPGKMDLWCHSHQVFHICVLLGAYTHYCGCNYAFLTHRRGGLCSFNDS